MTIRIFVRELDRQGIYAVQDVMGRSLVRRTRTPLLDSARALIAAGEDPLQRIELFRERSEIFDLAASSLAYAANLSVSEKPGPRFTQWQAFDRSFLPQ